MLIGTPFHHQGRVPGRGLDCVGLVLVIARDLGLTAFDCTSYPREPRPALLFAHARQAGFVEKPLTRAAGGDVLVMRFFEDPCHVAIATEGLAGIIHACARRGRVIEHRLDRRWRRRITGCLAFPPADGSAGQARPGLDPGPANDANAGGHPPATFVRHPPA